ncbi:MAG TPA: sugar ABC transporter permease [Solirubrobacteraceae bacterium]
MRLPWQLGFLAPAMLFLAAASIYPLVQLVRMSLSDVTPETIAGHWPFVGLRQLKAVFVNDQFSQSLTNTAIYTLVVLLVALVGGLIVALGLSRRGRLSKTTTTVMLAVWLAPPIASGLMWKFLLSSDGAINSVLGQLGIARRPIEFLVTGRLPLLSVALVNAWIVVPFAAIVLRSALLDVPRDILEQADVDGANGRQRLQHIVLPILRPALLVLGSLIVVYAFKSFDFIYVMTGGGPGTSSSTLPFLGWKLSFVAYQYGQGAAVAVIAMIIVSLFSIFYVRSVKDEVQA